MQDDFIICRCEEISLHEIEDAINNGAITLDEIKKATRGGMGLCQGRICNSLIIQLLASKGYDPKGSSPLHSRPPARPVIIQEYLGETPDE